MLFTPEKNMNMSSTTASQPLESLLCFLSSSPEQKGISLYDVPQAQEELKLMKFPSSPPNGHLSPCNSSLVNPT